MKPEDFRDPGGRKSKDKSNEKPKPSRSFGRKSSKSPSRPADDKSIERSNNSAGKATIEQPKTEDTASANVRAHSPFTN